MVYFPTIFLLLQITNFAITDLWPFLNFMFTQNTSLLQENEEIYKSIKFHGISVVPGRILVMLN